MRLLVIVNVYRPDLGGGVLFADLCEGLVDRGFEVEVRCAYPYYPEWTDKWGRNGLAVLAGVENGVTVRRHGLFIPRNPGSFAERLVYEASFFASLARNLPPPDSFDLVMAFCPLVGGVGFGSLAAKSIGCPLWLNVQDLSAEAAAAAGIVRGARAARAVRWVQRYLFNRAEVWSSIAPGMVERLQPLARHGQQVHELANWLHGSLAEAIAEATESVGPASDREAASSEASMAVSSARPTRLLYSGNIGGKQDLVRFCTELARSPAEFEFHIRGRGAEAADVQAWIERQGDRRFHFGDLTDEKDLARALLAADLFVVTEKAGAGGSFIPSKLLPAYGAGTPVWGVSDPDSPLGREMSVAGPGPVHTWEELPSGLDFLDDYPPDSDVFANWRRASRARSDYFDRENIIDRYANLISRTVKHSQTR